MAAVFLDTNILLRHLLGDHSDQSPRATSFLRQVEKGKRTVRTAETVVFEAVCMLERHYQQPKARIREVLLPLLELPGVLLPGKRRLRQVFDIYVDLNLPFADAYHAVLMKRLGVTEVVSFDRHFDRVPGITRLEP